MSQYQLCECTSSSSSPKILAIITCHLNMVYYEGLFSVSQHNFQSKLARLGILFEIFHETKILNYYGTFIGMRIHCSHLLEKEILRTIKQCKNKLRKEKSSYTTLIPIIGSPEGATNSVNTSNDSYNMSLQETVSK